MKNISFHPKLAAFIDIIANLAMFWGLFRLHHWQTLLVWFLIRTVIWIFFIRLVYYPKELSRLRHFISLAFFNIGVLFSLIFMEWGQALTLTVFIFIVFSAVSFWLLPTKSEPGAIFYVIKPYRRWLFLMDVFGLSLLWSSLYAGSSFQLINFNYFWLGLIFVSFLTALISYWWWKEYWLEKSDRLWWSAIIFFFIFLELSFVLWLWPLGFLVNGLILAWFWYVLWLMFRFNLSKEGVNWRKQNLFLLINSILFIVFLFIVKWN
jgi:hypothetical protein